MEKSGGASIGLAAQIYIALVTRNTEVGEGGVKMRASASDLATLSVKLADAFFKTSGDMDNAKDLASSKGVDAPDMASWSK